MAQIGDQLALAAGRVLRSGKVVMTAMSSPKKGDGLASGSPSAPPSQGPANVSDELTSGNTPNTLFRHSITPLCQDVRDTLMSRFSALAHLHNTIYYFPSNFD